MKKTILVLLLGILLVSCVSAWEWDNVKDYDERTKTLTVTNALGLGAKIAEIELKSDLVQLVPRGYNKVAEFEVRSFGDYEQALKEVELYDINRDNKKFTRDIDFKYKTTEDVEVDDYETICKDTYFLINGTTDNVCTSKKVGSHLEKKEVWEDFIGDSFAKDEVITLGIFTTVLKNDSVEWIPNMFGERVVEWAEWTESLTVGLQGYWAMEEASNPAIDGLGLNNGTNQGDFSVGGIIGDGFNIVSASSEKLVISDFDLTDAVTMSVWVNPDAIGAYNGIMGQNAIGSWCIDAGAASTPRLRLYTNGAGVTVTNYVTPLTTGVWQHYAWTWNGTTVMLYKNGTLETQNGAQVNGNIDADASNYTVGYCQVIGSDFLDGQIDETGLWNRTLSASEISDLYNGGVGITYTAGGDPAGVMNVTLNAPANNSNFTDPSITFNYTCTDTYMVDNSTLWVDGAVKNTNTNGVTNSTAYQDDFIMTDAIHTWKVSCWNNASLQTNSSTRSFNVSLTEPIITFNLPLNNTNYTSNTITFNWSVIDDFNVTNSTLWIDGVKNITIIHGVDNYTAEQVTYGMQDGNYNSTITAYDNDGFPGVTESRFFQVDTQFPNVTITSPKGLLNYGYDGINVTLNWTIVEDNPYECIYNYNGTNQTVGCSANTTNFTLVADDLNLTFWARDDVGNMNETYLNWSYILFRDYVTYVNYVKETSDNNFTINFTKNSGYILSSAYLNYNNTLNLATTTSSSTTLNLTVEVEAPAVSAVTNISSYWNINLAGLTINTSTSEQQVTQLSNITAGYNPCATGLNASFYFDLQDEVNLTYQNASINYNIQYGLSNNPTSNVIYGNLSDTNNFTICINNSEPYFSVGYGEIEYTIPGDVKRRFYIFENTRLTNQTVNNTLYGLITTSATSFQLTATSNTLIPYDDNYISLLRWYPNLNEYKVVEMGKTDDLGQTVLSVKTNDVDYRLGLYEADGTLIKLLNPIRMVCQTSPCVYSIIVSDDDSALSTFGNIQSNLSYNPSTGTFTYIWNDPSQDTTSMNLTVWKDYPDRDSVILCSSSGSGFTGVLVCDVSAYEGTLRAEAWRSASPPNLIEQLIEEIRSTFADVGDGSAVGLFAGLILVVAFALMGVVSPPLVVILTLIAMIPLVALGVINIAIFMIIGAIAGIVLHFLGRIT